MFVYDAGTPLDTIVVGALPLFVKLLMTLESLLLTICLRGSIG